MESKLRFYINPLKRERYVIPKHKCLYNIKSAERCFNRILKLYPDIVYPSSSFIDIPKTYKSGSVRAFVKDKNNKQIIGYIDKRGNKYKLQTPLPKRKAVPLVKNKNLSQLIERLPEISKEQQEEVERQFYNGKPLKTAKDINIIFNPLQNDFIPINQKLLDEEIADILSLVNKELIPTQLPPITANNTIAGILQDNEKIYGIIDTSNQLSQLDTPITIKHSETKGDGKSETESVSESIPESLITEVKVEESVKNESIPESLISSSEESIIDQDKIKNLPEVHFLEASDVDDMEKKLLESPVMDSKELMKKLECLDGSQWDIIEKRCISCDQYGLVWDPEYRSCKIMMREDIKKVEGETNVKSEYDVVKLKIVEDNKGAILGYLE